MTLNLKMILVRILSALPEIKWDECMKDEHPDEVAKHRSLDLLFILIMRLNKGKPC